MGMFTTDPCSNPRSHIKAAIKYSLETGHDGLALPWFGRTWLNHPYSEPMPWMQKLHAELGKSCTEAVVLPKHDHSTEWWQVLVSTYHEGFVCDDWQLNKRLQFDIPPDVLAAMIAKHEAKCKAKGLPVTQFTTSNNFCSSVIHWRRPDTARLELHDIATLWVRG